MSLAYIYIQQASSKFQNNRLFQKLLVNFACQTSNNSMIK